MGPFDLVPMLIDDASPIASAPSELELETEAFLTENLIPPTPRRPQRSTVGKTPLRYTQLPDDLPRPNPKASELKEIGQEEAQAAEFRATQQQAADLPRRHFRTAMTASGLYSIITRYGDELNDQEESSVLSTRDEETENASSNLYFPFANESSYKWARTFLTGSNQLSWRKFEDMTRLMKEPSFRSDDVNIAELRNMSRILGTRQKETETHFSPGDGWKTTELLIEVPIGHLATNRRKNKQTASCRVDDFYHRPIPEVIKRHFGSSAALRSTFKPIEMRYSPPVVGPIRPDMAVFGEIYWSSEFRKKYEEVQALPRETGDKLPRTIAALMFLSDGMQAAHFSSKKIWPIYLMFGNESQLDRSSPEMCCLQHIGHIPSVSLAYSTPDEI